jgi:NDP-sugar pyrophosphorylase family protein
MVEPDKFFDLDDEDARRLFDGVHRVWDLLPQLSATLSSWLRGGQTIDGEVMNGAMIGTEPIYICAGARVEPGAYVRGPAYIGPNAVVRHGAYLRENCVLLAGAVLGHASEMKNSVLLPGAKAPHFAYVGDSILGSRVNLGAGTKLSNATITGTSSILVTIEDVEHDTGLRKIGAILGDDTQIGCNAVLNPGTFLGRRVLVYPNTSIRGYHPTDSVLKLHQEIETVKRW